MVGGIIMGYKVILFDADDTLFDFKRSERDALKNAILHFNIEYNEDIHLKIYQEVNHQVWAEFEKGMITQEKLKIERFKRLSDRLGIQLDTVKFAELYMKYLSYGSFLYEETTPLIKNLYENYQLAIITNGLRDVQNNRIRKSTIAEYFDDIVISEEVKVSKPDPKIFEIALEHLKHIDKSTVLMVGDSLSSDIQGGLNFGIDTCWFNPHKKVNNTAIQPKYEISSLMALIDILNDKK